MGVTKFISLSLIVGTCATSGVIQKFLLDNGRHHVDIFFNSSQWRGFSLKDIFIARIPMEDVGKAHEDSFGIFLFDSVKDDLGNYLEIIIERRMKMSLLVISEPGNKDVIILIEKILSDLQGMAFFYIAIPTSSTTFMTWYHIISLKSGSALNNLEFADNSSRIIETFDMHGLEITSSSLTWAPYLTIDKCNKDGLECAKNYGYLIDIMDKLSFQFNFTYLSQKNINDSWRHVGTLDGVYGGVMGDVQSKQHDMSLSTWFWISSRDKHFDFVPIIQDGYVLAFRPEQSNIDLSLFTRAFVWDTWISLLSISSTIFLAFIMVKTYGITEKMNGIKIMTFIWWLLFTIVYSYYCGVLTMYFATPAPIPFETMSDVVQAYPNWKLMFIDGDEGQVYEWAENGNQDFISLWQRYQENPTQTVYDSNDNGLELIESGQNVIYIQENVLLGHLRSNPTKHKIHMIHLRKNLESALLLHDNSPLLSMFNQGVRNFREAGLDKQLFYKWFGVLDKPNNSTILQE